MKKYTLIVFFFSIVLSLSAQNSLLFYTFSEVPQSSLLNPAFRPTCNYHFSIPVLGSIHADVGSSGFAYNQLVTAEDYDFDYLVNHAHGMDYLSLETHVNLLSAGMEFKDFYFSFNLSNKLNTYFGYPNTLLEVPWYGNAEFIDQTANLSRLALDLNYYYEFSFGVSYTFDYKWQFGANAKILFGLANTNTSDSRIALNTDRNTYALLFNSRLNQNASFPLLFSTDPGTGFVNNVGLGEIDPLFMLLNFSNYGFAIDLGLTHQFSEQISVKASLIDLGFIRYRTNVHNLFHEGEIEYSGYVGTNLNTYFDALLTDIRNNYGFIETQNSYSYILPAQTYLSAEYKPTKFFEFGAVNRNQFLNLKVKSSLAIYTTILPSDKFAFMLSYGIINNGFNNIGAGFIFKTSVVQFHMISNNVVGLIYPYGARDLNLRIGLNIIFGCKEKKNKPIKSIGGCYWLRN